MGDSEVVPVRAHPADFMLTRPFAATPCCDMQKTM